MMGAKRSKQRTESSLRSIPTNLHVHTVSVTENGTRRDSTDETGVPLSASTVTCGAPAAHALGFGGGGLQPMVERVLEQAAKLNVDDIATGSVLGWSPAACIKTIHGEDYRESEPWAQVCVTHRPVPFLPCTSWDTDTSSAPSDGNTRRWERCLRVHILTILLRPMCGV
jgi:hypothetical protein